MTWDSVSVRTISTCTRYTQLHQKENNVATKDQYVDVSLLSWKEQNKLQVGQHLEADSASINDGQQRCLRCQGQLQYFLDGRVSTQ